MINRLLKIANILDRNGHEEDADFMTGLIVAYKKAQVGSMDGINQEADYVDEDMIEVPEDEMELLKQVFTALGDSLGESK